MQNKINSRKNNIIKMSLKLMNSSKQRREQNKFVVEGVKLCLDAIKSNIKIDIFLHTQNAANKNSDYVNKFIYSSKNSYILPDDLFNYVSDTKTSQGVMFVCEKPNVDNGLDELNGSAIALETIQDPKNLGAILRTAEAFDIKNIILTEDCCDYLSPKSIRASMGSVFRVNIIFVNSLKDAVDKLKIKGYTSYASVLNSKALSVKEVKFKEPCVVVIGNEGNGVKQETINSCDSNVYIPMQGDAQSLNAAVAAGILIWEITR